ncbi:hypothetical protein GCM10010168_19060 [Actinoplanes ianthinogenes]|uniref:Uncharacterized protein n=1 Tax=Actinoplanes ianthinogenes TaxID=122358 RepID=A0ABM7M7A7_9ACTN|nr:DUF6232 family protein [Actinoplanes ianthinogenes]BCJ47548.1 hypothetical protein Aiant_82050 [Actinoplanes ianthinogenes]GGR02522.1 hypothetical protein GCM10010168_19060 [Actinoplanes ianthinogenes]
MRIYYQDADVTVATSGVVLRGRAYALADIEDAWRGARRTASRKSMIAWAVLIAAIVVEAAVWWSTRWIWAGRGLLVIAAILFVRVIAHFVAGSTGLQALEDIRRYGRRQELWITVGGTPVRVLCTDDAIRYGQVCRALTRALNDHETVLRDSA